MLQNETYKVRFVNEKPIENMNNSITLSEMITKTFFMKRACHVLLKTTLNTSKSTKSIVSLDPKSNELAPYSNPLPES